MKANKRFFALVMTLALVATALVGLVACDRDNGQIIDATKTQINLKYYAGGLGTDWIDAVIKTFEEKYADYSFEEGKTGVQVMKTYQKDTDTPDLVKGSDQHLYITENVRSAKKQALLQPEGEKEEERPKTDKKSVVLNLLSVVRGAAAMPWRIEGEAPGSGDSLHGALYGAVTHRH